MIRIGTHKTGGTMSFIGMQLIMLAGVMPIQISEEMKASQLMSILKISMFTMEDTWLFLSIGALERQRLLMSP